MMASLRAPSKASGGLAACEDTRRGLRSKAALWTAGPSDLSWWRLPAIALILLPLVFTSPAVADFGVSEFTAKAVNQDGTLDTQAGSHPFEATTHFAFNQTVGGEYLQQPGNVKDVALELPAGFVGNPQATPQCPVSDLENGNCPLNTQVGLVTVTFGGHLKGPDTVDVWNLVPQPGHPAAFGFRIAPTQIATVQVVASVNSGHESRIVVTASDIPTGTAGQGPLPVVDVAFTFWGMPADPGHDKERGYICNEEASVSEGCAPVDNPSDGPLIPFLTNPTSCTSGPLTTTLRVDSWQNPGQYSSYGATSPQPTGCDKLSFRPTLEVEPETTQADTPSGYTFDLKVPASPGPYGLGTPELDDTSVTLPRGISIDPSAANGLQGCTDAQIAIGTEQSVACPDASKIGVLKVITPLLPRPLKGSIYLGTPVPGDEYRIFLDIEGFGISIRILGTVSSDPVTGQLTAAFKENPPLPFSDLKLTFFGGPQATLANSLTCGPAATTADLAPYGSPEVPDATPSSTSVTDSDGHGGQCPTAWPFRPSLVAGTTNALAGAYSPFTFQLSRDDRQQYISEIAAVSLPPGLLGNISAVPLCGSGEAASGACGPLSRIGQVTAGAGPGATPFYLGGTVYLTQGYHGDPFGLSIVVPAIAGPYDLGTVVVRAGIQVNGNGSVTVQADPVPTILEGIPLRLRYIGVTLERPDFMFNPTNCGGQSITASVASQQGTTAGVASPFIASGCMALGFRPLLVASTAGNADKAHGASLEVRIAQHSGESNIKQVDVQLPRLLPARLQPTLQHACTEAQFNSNPAGCPEDSVAGTATANTPILSDPLTGPAYFVSHGGAAFPDLDLVLQGEGITIVLTGHTDIKSGITYSRFEAVPDAPISAFDLSLPEGPHSALASGATKGGGNLCGRTLTAPTTIEGQNGARITQSTLIAVTGCTASKTKSLTSAQKLAKALRICVAQRNHKKRARCTTLVRGKYGVPAKARKSERSR